VGPEWDPPNNPPSQLVITALVRLPWYATLFLTKDKQVRAADRVVALSS